MSRPTKKLGEVLDYEQPGKYIVSSKNYSSEYKTPVLTAGKTFILGNTDEKENIFPVKKLPIIIFDDFTTAIKFVDFPFKVKSSAMKILHAKRDIADIKYVFYAMQTTGLNHATHKRYWISEYSKLEIPLPPLSEQKKIVAKLERVLAKIGEAKKLRAEARENADNLLSAELHKIFSQQHSNILQNVGMSSTGKNGWEEKEINDICEHPQYGFTASSTREKVGPKFLRITDIQEGKVNWETVPYCRCSDPDRYKLTKGDIVFARTGATVGKSYLITEVPRQTIYASYLIRLRVKDKVIPEFLYYFFQSHEYWEQITNEQVGMAQPNVNGSKLAKIKIPLPPLTEQKKIVARLDSLSEKIASLRQAQAKTQNDFTALEQSVLSKAFRD